MMKKYIGLVCGAVLFALLAAGCSGAFGFDGKNVGELGTETGGGSTGDGGGSGNGKANPFKGTTWEDSTNGITLSFDEETCKITKGTVKTASIARAATAGQVNAGTYSYTWKLNDDGSFTATLTIYNSTRGYATFTITASGASNGTLTITASSASYPFKKTTGGGTGGGTATETLGTFTINDDGKLVKYTIGNETDITIPETVTYIGDNAFNGCGKLTSVKIPASVQAIGRRAFSGCPTAKVYYDGTQKDWKHILFYKNGLDSVYTGLDTKKITGKDADGNEVTWTHNHDLSFWNNNEMSIISYDKEAETDVIIPFGVTSIGSTAFSSVNANNDITSVVIPSSVTEIEFTAFKNCESLVTVTLPEELTSIGYSAFTGCKSLTSITIPKGVEKIASSMFENCTSLASVILPEWLTSIDNRAFYKCTSLTSITIPDTVTEMGRETFWGCESLARVSIPVGITTIAQSAFRDCKKLTSVTIPDSVTSIG